MKTEALIETLAREVRPVPPHAAGRRLLYGILGGGVIALAFVAAGLGFRDDLAVAVQGHAFWMKWTYTISLGVGAIVMVGAARPA